MKLIKQKLNRGYAIILEIGGKKYTSYWTSPQERALNFEKEYLKERYSVITTDKRAKEFSSLYAKLWEQKTK